MGLMNNHNPLHESYLCGEQNCIPYATPSSIANNNDILIRIRKSVMNKEPVQGLTHTFYRYPARFSPIFANAMIQAFTKPGDLVIDPFMGGGTTLVESAAMGRSAIGTDINSLAVFIAKVKTTPLTNDEIQSIKDWTKALPDKLNLHRPPIRATEWIERGYQKNITGRRLWPIRKTLEFVLYEIDNLTSQNARDFIKCALLRTAQWALDCRSIIPSAKEFRYQFFVFIKEMLDGIIAYSTAVESQYQRNKVTPKVHCLQQSVHDLKNTVEIKQYDAPALILTSPPYPGVHVLYNRWQIQGRKETPAPYWIIGSADSKSESYSLPKATWFRKILRKNYCQLLSPWLRFQAQTILVQMVAFSNPDWQMENIWHALMKPALKKSFSIHGHLFPQPPLRYSNRKCMRSSMLALVQIKKLYYFIGYALMILTTLYLIHPMFLSSELKGASVWLFLQLVFRLCVQMFCVNILSLVVAAISAFAFALQVILN